MGRVAGAGAGACAGLLQQVRITHGYASCPSPTEQPASVCVVPPRRLFWGGVRSLSSHAVYFFSPPTLVSAAFSLVSSRHCFPRGSRVGPGTSRLVPTTHSQCRIATCVEWRHVRVAQPLSSCLRSAKERNGTRAALPQFFSLPCHVACSLQAHWLFFSFIFGSLSRATGLFALGRSLAPAAPACVSCCPAAWSGRDYFRQLLPWHKVRHASMACVRWFVNCQLGLRLSTNLPAAFCTSCVAESVC